MTLGNLRHAALSLEVVSLHLLFKYILCVPDQAHLQICKEIGFFSSLLNEFCKHTLGVKRQVPSQIQQEFDLFDLQEFQIKAECRRVVSQSLKIRLVAESSAVPGSNSEL